MAKCCVKGCSNKLEVGSSIRMFRFPALLEKPKSLVELSRQRRTAWLKALNRTNLSEDALKTIGICSDHFVTGSPARLKDNTEVDWIPTIKMGNQQRNRNEKISPNTNKVKRLATAEKLSELEKLKNELRCKDELIKSYKDESMHLRNQQKKIVNNYEERLKEKDDKIRMGIRELQGTESKEPQRKENHKKGGVISVRAGKILLKKQYKHKLIKPCVVRVQRSIHVKEEFDDDDKDNKELVEPNIVVSSLKNRSSKEATTKQPPSKDNSPRDLRSTKPNSNSTKTKTAKSEESIHTKGPLSRKSEETKSENKSTPINSALKNLEDLADSNSSISTKKADVDLQTPKPKPKSKKLDELKTTNERSVTKKIEEPVSAMASTRTRRAPKPNPKYTSDDIVTPKLNILHKRSKHILVLNEAGLGDTDSGDDYYYGDFNEPSDKDTNDNTSEAFEINDSSDFSDNDFLLKRKRTQRPISRNNSPSRSITPLGKKPRRALTPSLSSATSIVKTKPQPKQKPGPASQKTSLQTQSSAAASKKRKLEEIAASRKDLSESIIARNKRLNIALYDSNVITPDSPVGTATTKQNVTLNPKVIPTAPRSTASSVLNQKRQMPGPLSSKIGTQVSPHSKTMQLEKSKVKNDSSPLLQQNKSPSLNESSIDIFDAANTQDDFETMPTFTIVNINDIINKKNDCLIQKKTEDEIPQVTSPNSLNRNNRRKVGHNTILSEKVDSSKLVKPLPRTPFSAPPPVKTSVLQNKTPTLTKMQQSKLQQQQQRLSMSQSERKEIIKPLLSNKERSPATKPVQKLSPIIKDKPAPRILNSVVAKKTLPVQPILSKPDNDLDSELIDEDNNKATSYEDKAVTLKENVGANNKLLPTNNNKATAIRKLPAEKVFVQRQGNKLIKKITCFETWYVINIPESQEQIIKNCLDIPLITLSNSVKTIKLPSSSWSVKVTLYKLSAQMLNKSNIIPYTGDISEQSITEDDRNKYQPSSVMFRRSTQQKSQTRMPYDRAVIFKMKTFYTNIDGKNVRLIGAPSKISSFEDIEVLLELVDELDLLHEFVETANTV